MKQAGIPADPFSDQPNGSDVYKDFEATELNSLYRFANGFCWYCRKVINTNIYVPIALRRLGPKLTSRSNR